MPPTAAAGQLQRQQRSPSPPPFRAGFHFERAQTPDLASRQKEQQRLAQHNAFKATQPSCRKKQSCTAAGEDAGQEDWSAHAVASTATNTVSVKTVSDAGSTGYTPGVSGSGQAAAAVTPQARYVCSSAVPLCQCSRQSELQTIPLLLYTVLGNYSDKAMHKQLTTNCCCKQ